MDRAEWAEGRVCREVGRVGGAVCGRGGGGGKKGEGTGGGGGGVGWWGGGGGGGGAVCGRVGAFDQGACEFGGRWAACGWVGRLRRVSESSEGGRARRRRDGGKRGD